MDDAKTAMMVGLPESGKTTFLAALWHLITSNEVPGSLTLARLQGDREYLNRISERWRRFEPMDRTYMNAEETVELILRGTGEEEIRLAIPDISGESFSGFLEHREWTLEFDELLARTSGFLLFVPAGRVREPVLIGDVQDVFKELPEDDGGLEEDIPPWEYASVPTQTQLVELLQLFRWRRPQIRESIAVIVSAWDLVDAGEPEEWLKARLPLLWQYIKANSDWLESRVFGISAQGGKLPQDRVNLEAVLEASKRISVVGAGFANSDLSEPIKWILAGD